jgi:thymidylate synthase (FAD)
MKAQLVAITQPLGQLAEVCKTSEDILVYIARVSNPQNQANVETGAKLLRYCLERSHWSVFEGVTATFELQTSRAIAAQILRHRSFTFQEFSQRYAAVTGGHEPIELRMKGDTNRQGSLGVADPVLQEIAEDAVLFCERTYGKLLEMGVAPESARFVLPLATTTTLYMTGSLRSWITYFMQRCDAHAQKEHRLLALEMRTQLAEQLPVLAEALGWLKVEEPYENVDGPAHYNGTEVIDKMVVDHGPEAVRHFCLLNAVKYRARMGKKPGQSAVTELAKAKWYEAYAAKLPTA